MLDLLVYPFCGRAPCYFYKLLRIELVAITVPSDWIFHVGNAQYRITNSKVLYKSQRSKECQDLYLNTHQHVNANDKHFKKKVYRINFMGLHYNIYRIDYPIDCILYIELVISTYHRLKWNSKMSTT